MTICLTRVMLLASAVSAFTLPAPAQTPGREPYMQHCAQCHGARLQGGMAQSLVDGVWQFGAGRGYAFRNIKFGIPHRGMPGYEETLTDAEINQVLDFLQAAEKESGAMPPPPPEALQTLDHQIKVDLVAEGLDVPWAIAFVGPRHALVTERPGRLRQMIDGKLLPEPVAETPEVLNEGQGGLMDVAVDPDHAENGWVYLAYSHALATPPGERRPSAMTRIVRGHIADNRWTGQEVVFEAPHDTYRTTRHHYGCRIVFDPQGYLYFSIGDRGAGDQAQDLGRPNGKMHRIHRDGRIPDDNPFAGREGALPSVYSYGHRNPQGVAVHPDTGRVWASEHGPMGGDELNLIGPGLNYGWPVITYGRNYNGSTITEERRKPGMESPILYWRPSNAVCGIDFYRGDRFPHWNGRLLVATLKYEEVILLDIVDDRVMHQETILKNAGRVRDVACGPDGLVYVVLNGPGAVLRLSPLIR